MCAQSIHAALELSLSFPERTSSWYAAGNTVVALEIDDEVALWRLAKDLESVTSHIVKFFEPDFNDELTSIGCFVDREGASILKKLRLLAPHKSTHPEVKNKEHLLATKGVKK